MKDVFISFSFSDQDTVNSIVNELEMKYGISCWFCKKDVQGGERYKEEILDEIDNSNHFVVIISRYSMQSKDVAIEVGIASKQGKTIIPFNIDKSAHTGSLRYDLVNTNEIDATVLPFEDRIEELANAIKKACSKKQENGGIRINKRDFVFGMYYQIADKLEKSPIEWRIVTQDPEKMLLISKYVLDAQPYNDELKEINWEECSLRRWLNEVFFKEAFNEKERKRIIESRNDNESEFSNSKPCADTYDKVFLLSKKEVRTFFGTIEENRKSKATSYAQSRGAYIYPSRNASWWWLRSSGCMPDAASGVLSTGEIDPYNKVDYKNRGVRPAIWIKL